MKSRKLFYYLLKFKLIFIFSITSNLVYSQVNESKVSTNLYIIKPCLSYEVVSPSAIDIHTNKNITNYNWVGKLSMSSSEILTIITRFRGGYLATDLNGRTLLLKNANECLLKAPSNGYIVRTKETIRFASGEVLNAGGDYWSIGSEVNKCNDPTGFCEKILYHDGSTVIVPRSLLLFFPEYTSRFGVAVEKKPE